MDDVVDCACEVCCSLAVVASVSEVAGTKLMKSYFLVFVVGTA